MRVLIWGFGETALACAGALRGAGHSVTGVARSGSLSTNAAELGIELLQGDLHRPEEVEGLHQPFDVVLLAAATKPDDSPRDPWGLYVKGSRALIEYHRARPVSSKFVIFSTTSVYGPASVLVDGTIDESSPLDPQPKRARGRGAATAEEPNHTAAMEDVWCASGLPLIMLRLPGIHKPGSGALGRMMAREEFAPPTRDRTYQTINLEALARVVVAVCERGEPGEIFNVTPSCVRSMVARMKAAAAERGLSFEWPPQADLADHRMVVARRLEERLGIRLTDADG